MKLGLIRYTTYKKSDLDVAAVVSIFACAVLSLFLFLWLNVVEEVAQDIKRYFDNYYNSKSYLFSKDPFFFIISKIFYSRSYLQLLVNYQLIFFIFLFLINWLSGKSILNVVLVISYILVSRICLDFNLNTIRSSYAALFLFGFIALSGNIRFISLFIAILTHINFAMLSLTLYFVVFITVSFRPFELIVRFVNKHFILFLISALILGRFISIEGLFSRYVSIEAEQLYRYTILERGSYLSYSMVGQVFLLSFVPILARKKDKMEISLGFAFILIVLAINIHPIVQRFLYPIVLYFLMFLNYHIKYLLIIVGIISLIFGTLLL